MIQTFITVVAWLWLALFAFVFLADTYFHFKGDWRQKRRASAPYRPAFIFGTLASLAWIITTFIN